MAVSRTKVVNSNAAAFVRSLDKVGKEYNLSLLKHFSRVMDNITELADKNIIPRNVPGARIKKVTVKGKTQYYAWTVQRVKKYDDERTQTKAVWVPLYKIQKSTPGKVTERTGALRDVFRQKAVWNITQRKATLRALNKHLAFSIRPQISNGNTTYLLDAFIRDEGSTVDMRRRLALESQGGRMFFSPAVRQAFDTKMPIETLAAVRESIDRAKL